MRVTFRWGFARLLQVTHQLKGTMQYDNDVTWEMIFQMFTMNVPPLEWGAIDVFAHVSEIEESLKVGRIKRAHSHKEKSSRFANIWIFSPFMGQ